MGENSRPSAERLFEPHTFLARETIAGPRRRYGSTGQRPFQCLAPVNEQITGVWLVDADGRQRIPPSEAPERQKLNRACWKRYETESYLVHPASLARYIDQQTGSAGGADTVRRFLSQQFTNYLGKSAGPQVADDFIANPLQPDQAVNRYLLKPRRRTDIVSGHSSGSRHSRHGLHPVSEIAATHGARGNSS